MEYFLIEMQYAEYAAKEELIESLTDLSEAYNLPDLTLEQVEILNELSLATVGVYVTKVTSSITKAWSDFRSGFQDSMWVTFKKVNGHLFNSTFAMNSAENGITLPKLEDIRKLMNVKLPEWKDVENQPLENKAAFYKLNGDLSVLYEDGKSVQDKVNELYFIDHKGTIRYEGKDLVNYIKFMDDYGDLQEKIAVNIKQNNIDAKDIKAKAENAQAEAKRVEEKAKREQEKAKREAEKAKADADKEKAEAERKAEQEKSQADREAQAAKTESGVFNLANYLLEGVLYEAENKFSASEQQPPTADDSVVSTEEKSTGPLSDDDFKNKINKITIFFSGCTEVLSAKMKALNKARSLSFDIIKQYCKLANPDHKEKKKAEKKAEKEANKTS